MITDTTTTETIKVLIADDHAMLLDGLGCIVSFDPDCSVVAKAQSGQEALDLYRTHQPDIAILDIEMPDLTGIEVTEHIKHDDPHAKIIMLSGHGDGEWVDRALQAGATTYLSKVRAMDDLLDTIHAISKGEVEVWH